MKQGLINRMKIEPFRITLDTGNHTRLHKMFPVTVHLFDINFNQVMAKVLHMNMLLARNKSTAQFQFNSIDTLFNRFELSWNNVTGLHLDSTISNIGARNSIK